MSQFYKIGYIIILSALATSCIDSYTPKIDANDISKYVVIGEVNNNQTEQTVTISLTSSANDPKYIPVIGCSVNIEDKNGNVFNFIDQGNGEYSGDIDQSFMTPGSSFKLNIKTPDGETIESDYDQMNPVANIDTIYYKIKDQLGITPGDIIHGIQFYLNVKDIPNESKYFKWNVYETWEYHTKYPVEWYYDGTMHHVFPPDSSKMICWRTLKVPEIYTLNSSNVSGNTYNSFPINFVSNRTNKLAIEYSLLVEQEALSKEAYEFWDKMRINISNSGGLYESQPMLIQGNIHNVTNPAKEVLGFFSAVCSVSKRIFVNNVQIQLNYTDYCSFDTLKIPLRYIQPYEYPVYFMPDGYNNRPSFVIYRGECVDCLLFGGTNVKPSYWPEASTYLKPKTYKCNSNR
ncbi:MAG: DUF4249 domain-containing protein [Bacteroidales bacterium]|nr:DUF4249 domain-containing protein [Bacteroidales bacterium]